MGKAAGAVLTAAAPEAKVASKAAAAAGGRAPRKITPDMSPAQVNEELQARGADAKARSAARKAGGGVGPTGLPAHVPTAPTRPATTRPAPASPGAGPSLPQVGVPASVQTGSGFLLGVVAWACGLAYLRGGSPEVKKLLAAKFLNKTSK